MTSFGDATAPREAVHASRPTSLPANAATDTAARSVLKHACVLLAVFLSFVGSSALRRPVPSVNEPHYLGKAKHYWEPQWCAGDLFLESSNAHLVFYQTIGWLTRGLTLAQTAWAGRLLALALLAWGWTALISQLTPEPWAPLTAAWLFLLLQALGDLSGEWLVGGVESKVFSYAFGFAGLARGLDRRWLASGMWMGLAISFHPVVGLWCVIAAALATACFVINRTGRLTNAGWESDNAASAPLGWRQIGAGGGAMLVCALPGLLPALRLVADADPQLAARADRLQVGGRLAHHLDPLSIPLEAYRYYALLLVLVCLVWRFSRPTRNRRRFAWFVGATVFIAAVGVMVGWGPRPLQAMPFSALRVWLLKFYPFRLADLFVPVLVAVTVLAAGREAAGRGLLSMRQQRAARVVPLLAFVLSLILPTPDRNPSRMSPGKRADWIAACQWIREQTPPDALLYAANDNWAVKWFTHRAEYVNYKDCPQDAAGIIEWDRRRRVLQDWAEETFADGRCSAEELATLHAATGITHLTASRLGPIDVEPVYRNRSFRVYAIGVVSDRVAKWQSGEVVRG
jgi:hypothetical protein